MTNLIEDESDEPVIPDGLDEISWLNGKDNNLAEWIRSTGGDRFTLAGLEGIEIRSGTVATQDCWLGIY